MVLNISGLKAPWESGKKEQFDNEGGSNTPWAEGLAISKFEQGSLHQD